MKKRTLEYRIRRLKKSIISAYKESNRAYRRNHNIIGVVYANKAYRLELDLQKLIQKDLNNE